MNIFREILRLLLIFIPSMTFAGGNVTYKGYTYESDGESLLITSTSGEVKVLDVGPLPGPMCIDHERRIGYIMSHGEQSVTIIDLEKNQIVRTINCSKKIRPLKSQSM